MLNIADNMEVIIFWIGISVSPQILLDLFAVDDIMNLDIHMVCSLPGLKIYILTCPLEAEVACPTDTTVIASAQHHYA